MIAKRYKYGDQTEIEFDYSESKSDENRRRHGISFDEARDIWRDFHIRAASKKKGDRRYVVVGSVRNRCYAALVTCRGFAVRIDSGRPAREGEAACYEREKQ